MSIETLQQAKNSLQSLTESLWIFTALNVLSESKILTVLNEEKTLEELEKTSKLPKSVLEQTINLLIETGFIIAEKNYVILAPGMQALIEKINPERFAAQLRTAFGLTSEFIKSSREQNLKTGWHYQDELILQAQGAHSEYIVTDCIPQDANFQNILKKDNSLFLDVGAGVGKISLRLCQDYDNIRVIALEPADAPFFLAKKNITESPYNDRITLRKTYIQDLTDSNLFDAAWFPHVFFPDELLHVSLINIWEALKPGGMLLTTAILPEKLNQSLYVRQLINTLYGGLRTANDMTNALKEIGFQDIKVFSEVGGYRTITACKQR